MATELKTGALTSLARVKDRIGISDTGFDTVLERIINGVTDEIQSYCNRIFKQQTYTNEVYSPPARGMDTIALKQAPVVSISAAEYRAGSVSTPSWTGFTTDQFEIVNDGASGLVRIYGGVPYGTNAIRFTYLAGYKVDFENPNDTSKHTLPFDLSDIAERLTIKRFKRREAEGKLTESFESGSVTWQDYLTVDDKRVLDRYGRLPQIV